MSRHDSGRNRKGHTMSATDKANTSIENLELTDEMLETVSGGEINVAQEMFLDRFISSRKELGETPDEVVAFFKKHNGVANAADLKGFWAWIANADPAELDEMCAYVKKNW